MHTEENICESNVTCTCTLQKAQINLLKNGPSYKKLVYLISNHTHIWNISCVTTMWWYKTGETKTLTLSSIKVLTFRSCVATDSVPVYDANETRIITQNTNNICLYRTTCVTFIFSNVSTSPIFTHLPEDFEQCPLTVSQPVEFPCSTLRLYHSGIMWLTLCPGASSDAYAATDTKYTLTLLSSSPQ